MKRLRGSQWPVAAALLLAAACGAEAPSTAPDISAPSTTADTVVAVAPTTMVATTTTAPPPDPAECERLYSELIAEEVERRRVLLSGFAERLLEGQWTGTQETMERYDDQLVELIGLFSEFASSHPVSQETADTFYESVVQILLDKDQAVADFVAHEAQLALTGADGLANVFIDLAGPEGLVGFEAQAQGCVCSQEPSVIAEARFDQFRAFLANEAARQFAVVDRLVDERSRPVIGEAQDLADLGLLDSLGLIEVQRHSDEAWSERSLALKAKISDWEFERFGDWLLEVPIDESYRLLANVCGRA